MFSARCKSIFFFFQTVLAKLQPPELLEVAAEAFQNRKSLLMDIINRRAISDNQPNPEVPVPSWCPRYREMPKQKEWKCCNKHI